MVVAAAPLLLLLLSPPPRLPLLAAPAAPAAPAALVVRLTAKLHALPDIVLLDFFTSYHGGESALIYERVVRLLLSGSTLHSSASSSGGSTGAGASPDPGTGPGPAGRAPSPGMGSPPVVMFVNFFEFADRHHATSQYTTVRSVPHLPHMPPIDAHTAISLTRHVGALQCCR